MRRDPSRNRQRRPRQRRRRRPTTTIAAAKVFKLYRSPWGEVAALIIARAVNRRLAVVLRMGLGRWGVEHVVRVRHDPALRCVGSNLLVCASINVQRRNKVTVFNTTKIETAITNKSLKNGCRNARDRMQTSARITPSIKSNRPYTCTLIHTRFFPCHFL